MSFTKASTTASSGPNHWDTAANWSLGTVPVNTNDVILENNAVSILYGLDQNAVTLASLTRKSTYTGYIGLPKWNETGYPEYRDTYLKISSTIINDYGGSGRFKINVGSAQTTMSIMGYTTSVETGVPSVCFLGTHASNSIEIVKGDLGIAFFGGEVSTVAALKQGYLTNQAGDSKVQCGTGVTLGTVTKTGGTLYCDASTAAITAINQFYGTTYVNGVTNALTTLNNWTGTVFYNSSGTLTTVILGPDAVLDFRGDMTAKTVTNCTRSKGSKIYDPARIVTFTNGIDCVNCGLEDGIGDLGQNMTISISNI